MNRPSPVWLLDANVLVALTVTTHLHHRAAHASLAAHPGRWATTPVTEGALVRLLLNPQVTGQHFSRAQVLAALAGLRSAPGWQWLPDATSLATPLIDLTVLAGHRQVTDVHLVNLAAQHGAVLVTFDHGILATLAPADRQHVLVLT